MLKHQVTNVVRPEAAMADLEDILRTEPAVVTALSALTYVANDHEQHLRLCDLLEEIADSLPDRINQRQCVCAAMALSPPTLSLVFGTSLENGWKRGQWLLFLLDIGYLLKPVRC